MNLKQYLLALAFLPCLGSLNTHAMTLGIIVHNPAHVASAAAVGYTAIRLWDTGTDWASVEPKPGVWDFRRIDAFLAASEKAHLKVLWTLGNTPRWASAHPNERCAYGFGCAAEPADILDWRLYVRTVATRFRGRIECYEPWNEVSFPNDPTFTQPGAGGDPNQFFSGTVADMVNIARVAYQEIKRADPHACVLSPSFNSSGNWAEKFDRYLAAGGGKYFDVVSQHFYFPEEPEQVVPVIRVMRQIMAKYGLSHVPIWNTEVGVSFQAQAPHWRGMTLPDLVYALTLRTYLLNASEGVSRVYWYAWDDRNLGFFAKRTGADFGSAAAAAVVHLLRGLQAVHCKSNADLWQCQVSTNRSRFSVVWLAGRNVKPIKMVFKHRATRWGRVPRSLPAGKPIELNGRPVVVRDGNARINPASS